MIYAQYVPKFVVHSCYGNGYKKGKSKHFIINISNGFDINVRLGLQYVLKSQYLGYFPVNNLLRRKVWVKLYKICKKKLYVT
jgi:hypothetical protein